MCAASLRSGGYIFVGTDSPHKGVELLVKAFVRVASKYADVSSSGRRGKQEFRAGLEREIVRLDWKAACVWGFARMPRGVRALPMSMFTGAPPSRSFTSLSARSVVEAMAHGVPIVCSRSGALQEIALAREDGATCEEVPSDWRKRSQGFMQNPGLRNRTRGECACEVHQSQEQTGGSGPLAWTFSAGEGRGTRRLILEKSADGVS